MVPPPRTGSFSPNPVQTRQTGSGHPPHSSQSSILSAAASPSTSSPTGSSSLTKIAITQVSLLLSTIKDESDPKYGAQVSQLRKLIDEHGMEVYSRFLTRLVAGNASQIFPGLNRQAGNSGNYNVLVSEMRKIGHDPDQASMIADSIETGTEDIFRDFDLSTFMEHFQLDALEKTLLALAFKLGSRPDLKTKADAILSTNFPTFTYILSRADLPDHSDLTSAFVAKIVDRFVQYPPPNFQASAKAELASKVKSRYVHPDSPPPSEVLAALDLIRILSESPHNALALYIQRTGVEFTRDEETCLGFLQSRPANVQLTEEQVAAGLMYCVISQTPSLKPSILTAALRRVLPTTFRWFNVVTAFDKETARISSDQFLSLYHALLPIAQDEATRFDLQALWGGNWANAEAQLSFVCAFVSLTPEQLDASTIPGLVPTITLDTYTESSKAVQDRASVAVKHPLVSVAALSTVFHVALHSEEASKSIEAKRLFQDVVVHNLDIFVVSASGVPKPWPTMALDTLSSLLENFIYKMFPEYDFVLESLWKRDKEWVMRQLVEVHAAKPMELGLVFEHAVRYGWLQDLTHLPNGFGLDLTALAHAEGCLDLTEWARRNADRSDEMAKCLMQFLIIKADQEMQFQRPSDGHLPVKASTPLQVRTVSALLQTLEDFMPRTPLPELIAVQRQCITAYPRLINYGEGHDDIIDTNGKDGNALPSAANLRMEEHYKMMYGNDIEVRDIVEVLDRYKRSRDPLEQDVFACMIHGLFDEYTHYSDYPLEALATTAVLFGGIISHKLISDLPLKIGLGMILESVRDHTPEDPMYKFGLQALIQLLPRFHEWPGFCKQLLLIPDLRGTDAWLRAEEVIRDQEELSRSAARSGVAAVHHLQGFPDDIANGVVSEALGSDQQAPPFTAIRVEPPPADVEFEEPNDDDQGKIQFVLNNITETTLQSMCSELREMLERRHQQWFASHLVEERAKMQPNYHGVYIELVNLLEDRALWAEVLRETYSSVARMLNAESTMQNSTERTHLKNLGGWLGLLTLARNKPIKHRNIAFKKLLLEAHDTKRLVVVIPFVCKVLLQGALSTVFRPPNPWLMDIIHLLIELYHQAELKLNLKFEIEVLCKGLNLDHKNIKPSGEIENRAILEDPRDLIIHEPIDSFEGINLNGIVAPVAAGLTSHAIAPVIPDIGPMITIPPTNDLVVSTTRLHEIVRNALTRALTDIIGPVVDRSVTIAAISTQQMIHKDFAIEPDENRVRACALNMVKATAGSLALVTSKEPLRANFTNQMRNLPGDLPQGLPEGTVMMCVNANLDLGCSIIEKQAEERAIPEIEEMIEEELESRRRHRAQKPMEPYAGPSLNRWASALPQPYRLVEGMNGLTPEQMAIYEDFARHPRNTTSSTPAHGASVSDTATRSLANEVLQEQYTPALPSIPTASETASAQHLAGHMQPYPPAQSAGATNGRPSTAPVDLATLAMRFQKLLIELQRAATEAREEHFHNLPRPHAVLELVDALVQILIKTSQNSEEMALFAADQISQFLFMHIDDSLCLETLAHVLDTLRKIAGPAVSSRIRTLFRQQPGQYFLHLPLLTVLANTDLVDWKNIDAVMSKMLQQKKDGALEFLETLMDLVLLNDRPVALHADFVKSLEAAWSWLLEDSESAAGQRLKAKLTGAGVSRPVPAPDSNVLVSQRQDQMEYVFDEWVHLSSNANATEKSMLVFLQQIQANRVIGDRDDFFLFVRLAIDLSVDRFELVIHPGGVTEAFMATDALARLIGIFVRAHPAGLSSETNESRPAFFEAILALVTLVLHSHHTKRGEHFNQRVFFRLLSMMLHEVDGLADYLPANERLDMLIKFAVAMRDIGPRYLPGFTYAWMSLLQHRAFLPSILGQESRAVWGPATRLICDLLEYLGDQLKVPDLTATSKEVYRSVLKFLVVLQHDFPDFIATNYNPICWAIPAHCAQLFATVLAATPPSAQKNPETTNKADDLEDAPVVGREVVDMLQKRGILEVLTQALQDGPSEGALAHIVHSITRVDRRGSGFGHASINVDLSIVEAIPSYVVCFAVDRARQKGGPVYVPGSSDSTVLALLVRELNPEARYYLVSAIVNQLRFPNAHTHYFRQLLLDIFGHDLSDGEETEVRQQITRILLERLVGYWAQPWGLMMTVMELLKNEKYMFFEQPFIKAAPEVAERFLAVLRQ